MRDHGFAVQALWSVAVAAATIIFLTGLLFTLWYSQFDWRATTLGRNFMHFTGVIALAFGFVTLFAWLDVIGWRPFGMIGRLIITVIIYSAIAVLVVQRLLAAYWTQREWEYTVLKAARLRAQREKVVPMVRQKKSQPVLIWLSILAGMDLIVGSSALANYLPADAIGFVSLVMAGINVAVGFYLRGEVVPFRDAAAYVDSENRLVAGPAAMQPNGTEVQVVEET